MKAWGRASDGENLARLPFRAGQAIVMLCLAAALVLWIVSLPRMQPDEINDFGIVAILPWQYWLALGCVTTGFSVSLVQTSRVGGLRIAALIVLILPSERSVTG